MSKKLKFLRAGLVAAILGVATMAAQGGSGPAYCRDEAKNKAGPNRCTTNQDCDGARTCSGAGWCQGTSRKPDPGAKGPNYCWDEAKNPRGPNQCSNNNECDGARTCSSAGWCQGTAGHSPS
ncbi:MAG: hypothetical protein ACREYF_02775 [Gammaproteobacteria bacterium]